MLSHQLARPTVYNMGRVLFIAYDFPPGSGIGAGLRSAHFVRNLPDFGWQPQVVALDDGQTAVSGITRLSSLTPWHRPYELTPYGWAWALMNYVRGLKEEKFDLVYVSCPPFPQALATARFAMDTGLPLVVDFRDAWALDPYQEGSRLKRLLYRYLFPVWERWLIERCSLLLLNTPSALSTYQRQYAGFRKKMAWLPNGYDESVFPDVETPQDENYMLLRYVGRFGIGARSPSNLLKGIAMAHARGCEIRLEILGDQPKGFWSTIEDAGLQKLVQLTGQVTHEEAVKRMCTSPVLVLIQAPSPAAIQAVAGKTFDYLRAGRPILAITPAGDNLDLVREYAARYETPLDEPSAIADAICRLHQEWRDGLLPVHQSVNTRFCEKYERRVLCARLAAHFDRVQKGISG